MAQRRTRDDVWITALELTSAGKVVTPDQIADETGASDRTVRETLNVMKDTPFLSRDLAPDGTVQYTRGPAFDVE